MSSSFGGSYAPDPIPAPVVEPGARAHYDRRRAAGDHHNAALRHLANSLLSKVWHCLQHQQAWNEQQAWPTRADQPAAAA